MKKNLIDPPAARLPTEEEKDAFEGPVDLVFDLTCGEKLDSCIGHIRYVQNVITGLGDWNRRVHTHVDHLKRARLLLDGAIAIFETPEDNESNPNRERKASTS